ncbi:hypothetical protein [Bradyrhizobium elkanii]|uniref:hypothetical protein n=1 Tax=Bradyrhizobium elkanii TaxID=29448 RepID=UPI003518E973
MGRENQMKRLLLAAVIAVVAGGSANAETFTLPQLQQIFESSPNAHVRHSSSRLASLAIDRSGGDSAKFNGTCCSGLFQINRSQLHQVGLTSDELRHLSPIDQVAVYVRVTADHDSDLDADALRKLRIEPIEVHELPPLQAR